MHIFVLKRPALAVIDHDTVALSRQEEYDMEVNVAIWLEEYLVYKDCADDFKVRQRYETDTAMNDHFLVHEWASVLLFGSSFYELFDTLHESDRCDNELILVLGNRMHSFSYEVGDCLMDDAKGDPAAAATSVSSECFDYYYGVANVTGDVKENVWQNVLDREFDLPDEFCRDGQGNDVFSKEWACRYTDGHYNGGGFSVQQIWVNGFSFSTLDSLKWHAGCNASFLNDYEKSQQLCKRGGGIRRKNLSRKQLERKILRNKTRENEFKMMKIRDQDYMFTDRQAFLRHLEGNADVLRRLLNDPIQEVDLDSEDQNEPREFFGSVQEDQFFEFKKRGKLIAVKKARTNTNMNSVCGFCVIPEWDMQFQQFVRDRDIRLKKDAKSLRKKNLLIECSQPCRSECGHVEDLFDAVADCFRDMMHSGDPFAFKYCPVPGCSADKATGTSPQGGGIGYAVMRRMGFPGMTSICYFL